MKYYPLLAVSLTLLSAPLLPTSTGTAQAATEAIKNTSPVLKIDRKEAPASASAEFSYHYRTLDGSYNNLAQPAMNRTGAALARLAPSAYSDRVSGVAGANRPNPRLISSLLNEQTESSPNSVGGSDFVWQWGQFIDHDLGLTDGVEPAEHAYIDIPPGDPWFDPRATGTQTMAFNRSIYDHNTGTHPDAPRQQINEVTGWIDASQVYGSDEERARALRTLDGTGRLKTSAGNLLPFNEMGLSNAGGPGAHLFVAGDVRVNEQVGLTAMHTLFMREHNRLAARIAGEHPGLSGDEIYQRARRLVAAQMQVITYEEFLPVLLGPNALRPYTGYKPDVDAGIANLFSTAAFRLGHSLLSHRILRIDREGREIEAGHLPLREAFFSPQRIIDEGGIEPILRGLAAQVCPKVDVFVVEDIRNFLFGAPGSGGFDLVALNIQRGRDHGLPDYNSARQALGLPAKTSFAEITAEPELQERLARAYGSVDDIDVWVGGLAEDPLPGSALGELFHTILVDQFEVLRDGDRFWYQRSLSGAELREISTTRLSQIIRRNTAVSSELNDNVFIVRPQPDAAKDDARRFRRHL